MDKEVFKLSQEVYEKTSWEISKFTEDWYLTAPIYTSDFILGKLQDIVLEKSEGLYRAWYNSPKERYKSMRGIAQLHERADTPLKALLKLTKALAQAGEL